MIDTAGKSVWFDATQLFWFCAPLIYLACGSTAINLYDSVKYYKTGVIFAVSPLYILAIHLVTIYVYR